MVCLDLAFELLLLPLSYIALGVGALLICALLAAWWHPGFMPWVWFSLACGMALFTYVMRGWQLSGMGARGLLDLLGAPIFVAWKLLLMLRSSEPQGWVHTSASAPDGPCIAPSGRQRSKRFAAVCGCVHISAQKARY